MSTCQSPPYPSLADAFWLAVYAPIYVALLLLLRSRAGAVRRSVWLDGVIAGLAVAAVGTAVVFQAVLEATSGSKAAIATNLAYPLADLTTIALVVWVLAVSGWRIGRTWGLIAAGLLVFSVSDCLYLFQTACRLVRCRRRNRPGLGRRLRAARLGGMATGRACRFVPASRAGRYSSRRSAAACWRSPCSCTTISGPSTPSPSCSRRQPSWPCSCAWR